MLKVKVLSRNPDDYIRETKWDIHKAQRNYDSSLHPFEAPREYTRALNAVKLERVFAKPFIGSLDGHKDGIQCLMKHPSKLSVIFSGCCDGEVKIWNIANRQCLKTFQAHTGFVRGMCFTKDDDAILTVGEDNTIKTWTVWDDIRDSKKFLAKNIVVSKTMLTGVSHNIKKNLFATCGEKVDIWDSSRAEPMKTFRWGNDTIKSINFNPIQTDVLGGCANDRSIVLYDTREKNPLRKVVMSMCANKMSWNPMEAFVFTAASEDENLHTYDMRNLSIAMVVHYGHAAAVLDVDYAPTGKEFVSASYDKSLQIFGITGTTSREIYYTKRMQRLSNVIWSLDNKYVLCGSDEMNIRIWKSHASEKLGLLNGREQSSLEYSETLKEKFCHHPEIRRIARHRQIPNAIRMRRLQKHLIREKQKRKIKTMAVHNKIFTEEDPKRTKNIINEVE